MKQGTDRTALANGTVFHADGYRAHLSLRETENAIGFIKDAFQNRLAAALNVTRVSAPMLVPSRTGLNDLLDGVQKPVSFAVKGLCGETAEIVQSLAKWKRAALADYGFDCGEGLYTDMNALRPDEALDNFHSVYVDQWDWERVIAPTQRTVAFLHEIVRRIYAVIRDTEVCVCARYPQLPAPFLPSEISFVHSQDLEDRFPELAPREREQAICRERGAVFVIGIGARLASGVKHDDRAADYDDWITPAETGRPGLNGDILVWHPTLNCAMELSSMGIRVEPESLRRQLAIKGEQFKESCPFHQRLLAGALPSCIGGGIGQSRLCMLLLRKAHVGEVQASVWPEDMIADCRARGMRLL